VVAPPPGILGVAPDGLASGVAAATSIVPRGWPATPHEYFGGGQAIHGSLRGWLRPPPALGGRLTTPMGGWPPMGFLIFFLFSFYFFNNLILFLIFF
jgi:hypothetical protein